MKSSGAKGTIVLISNTLWYLYTFRWRTVRELQDDGWRVVCLGKNDGNGAKLESLGCLVLPLDWQINSDDNP